MTGSSLSKKDYELIAHALYEATWSFAQTPEEMRLEIINRISDVLLKDNPKFNAKKFKEAAT